MKTLDSLNERIETIRQSIEHTEQTVADLQKELEEAERKAQQATQETRTTRWIEVGLVLVGVIGLVVIYRLQPQFLWIIAGILALILIITIVLELSAGIRRRTSTQAITDLSKSLEEKAAILKSRGPQLEMRFQERDAILDLVKRLEGLEVPYIPNFVRNYQMGTAEQREHIRELLSDKHDIEVSEILLMDLLEDELEAQQSAEFAASLSAGLTSLTDCLTHFLTIYGSKGNKDYLLRLLKKKGFVEESFTVSQLDEALEKREHEMRMKTFGATLETTEE